MLLSKPYCVQIAFINNTPDLYYVCLTVLYGQFKEIPRVIWALTIFGFRQQLPSASHHHHYLKMKFHCVYSKLLLTRFSGGLESTKCYRLVFKYYS